MFWGFPSACPLQPSQNGTSSPVRVSGHPRRRMSSRSVATSARSLGHHGSCHLGSYPVGLTSLALFPSMSPCSRTRQLFRVSLTTGRRLCPASGRQPPVICTRHYIHRAARRRLGDGLHGGKGSPLWHGKLYLHTVRRSCHDYLAHLGAACCPSHRFTSPGPSTRPSARAPSLPPPQECLPT